MCKDHETYVQAHAENDIFLGTNIGYENDNGKLWNSLCC